jgi:hypothetical protein
MNDSDDDDDVGQAFAQAAAGGDGSRDGLGRFLKGGRSANPRGRPRTGLSLAERIRARVDKEELITIALEIARGRGVRVTDADGGTGAPESWGAIPVAMPSAKDQLAALNLLMSYAWSKPPAYKHVAVDEGRGDGPADFDGGRLAPGDLADLKRLLSLAAGSGGDDEDD